MSVDQNCWPSQDSLHIGYLNINHDFSNIMDATTIISNSGKQFYLFDFSESRLTDNMPSSDLLSLVKQSYKGIQKPVMKQVYLGLSLSSSFSSVIYLLFFFLL